MGFFGKGRRKPGRPTGKRLVAAVAAAATLVGGIVAPAAFADGGSGSGTGSGGSESIGMFWQYRDSNTGSFGPASNFASVQAAFNAAGVSLTGDGVTRAQQALASARSECESNFAKHHPGEGAADCRVVGVGSVYVKRSSTDDGSGWAHETLWQQLWDSAIAPGNYYHGGQGYRVGDPFEDDASMSVTKLMQKEASKPNTGVIVIVLNKYQPKPPAPSTYRLNVTTNVNAPANLTAGSRDAVSDVIHARGGNGEKVNANAILHYDGGPTMGAKSAAKSVSISTNGDTTTPQFTPSDLGMANGWESGRYWFDVQIAKQGLMDAAVDTADREASESFTILPYQLSVTTQINVPDGVRVGGTDAVSDVIHARGGNGEKVDMDVVLRYDGNDYVEAKSVTKRVSAATNGDTTSPQFSPSDLGLKDGWEAGTYWFDIKVAKQKNMAAAVDTPDREASESFRVSEEPPTKLEKSIEKGVSADAMVNRTTIVTGTGRGGYEMTIRDIIDPKGQKYTVDTFKMVDLTDNNKDISNQFTINWDQATNTVSAVRTADKGRMPGDHDWQLSFDVTMHTPAISEVVDHAERTWNHTPTASTDSKKFPTWAPNPDKSWVKQTPDGKWAAVIDPDETNATGADRNRFLDGEKVASVVNGIVSADLIDAPTRFELMDDWTRADYIFDADPKGVKVYMADAGSNTASSVYDIVNKGKDVTDRFDIKVEGTKAVAAMKADALRELQGLKAHRQYTLLIPGVTNFANGGGAEQVREDAGKQPGDEVEFCTVPSTDAKLTNSGSQTINGDTKPTNEPWICGYVPPVKKDVVSEASQGGEQESVQGKTVFPGQKLEYQLTTTPKLPGNLAYTVEHVAVTDQYDQWLVPDKQTVEVMDLSTGKSVSKKSYTTVWDDAAHTFTLTFDEAWVDANWKAGTNPRIMVRFEGTVSEDAPNQSKVENQWQLTLNNTITPSNKVFNVPPTLVPDKKDTQADPTIDIDGRTALLGDRIYYRIGLDASKLDKDDLAYRVQRLGIVDDYDDEYLTLDTDGIEVLDQAGKDVTDRFNIQDKDGVAYVFAKTVDTQIPATGETVKGDPQPTDLKDYCERKLDPLKDAYIDQQLLGQKYQVVLPMTVSKVSDGYVVKNKAIQVTNDRRDETNTVSNPLKEINPAKDVVVNMGDESANGKSIYLNHTFLYQLDSSILPTNRAYPKITDWRIVDRLDTTHDKYTGQWAVYATRDLTDGDSVLAKRGERIASSTVDGSRFGGALFEAAQADDGTVTVTATQRYLDLVSAKDAEAGWRAYLQCERIATGERIVNTFTETINGVDRPSNEVWTHTPDLTPSIDVEKFDWPSGEQDGDRDEVKDALKMESGDIRIGIRITNTSRVDKDGKGMDLTRLALSDKLLAGSGTLTDIEYPKDWDTLVLKPGESIVLPAMLRGVKAGDKHTNRVTVTARPIIDCPVLDDDPFDDQPGKAAEGPCYDTAVRDTDDWNGYRAKPANPLASTGAGIALAVAVMVGLGLTGTILLLVGAKRRATVEDDDTEAPTAA